MIWILNRMTLYGHIWSQWFTFGHIWSHWPPNSEVFYDCVRCIFSHDEKQKIWHRLSIKTLSGLNFFPKKIFSVDATKNQEKILLKHAFKIFRPLSSQPNQSSSHHLSLSLSIYLNLFFFFSLSSSSIICLWFSVFTFSSLCVSLNYISFSRSN